MATTLESCELKSKEHDRTSVFTSRYSGFRKEKLPRQLREFSIALMRTTVHAKALQQALMQIYFAELLETQQLQAPETVFRFLSTHTCVYYVYMHVYMMQGCHTPPPPPHPMVSPLACQVGSCLFGLVAFPVWSCLASSPPPLWSGACGLFGRPRPGSVFYRGSTEVWYGCCRLLVVLSSLRPSPPCGVGACGRFGGPRPPVWGSVFYRDMVWLLTLVSSNVIVTCSLPYKI